MTVSVNLTTLYFESTASRSGGDLHGGTGQTNQTLPFTGQASQINHAVGAGIIQQQIIPGDNIAINQGLAEGVGVIPPASLMTGAAYTGGQADATLDPVTGSADGLNTAPAAAAATLPGLIGAAHAFTGELASTPTDHPPTLLPVTGVAYCAAVGAGTLLPVTGAGIAFPDAIVAIQGDAELSPVWGVAYATNPVGQIARGAAILLPVTPGSGTGDAGAFLPHVFGRAYAVGGVAAVRVQWAMNIENNAVTEWSNVPFLQMGRAFNDYWAVGIDGNLYQWGGDVDPGPTPISWSFQTGLSDLGTRGVKGLLGIYLDGIFEPGIDFTLQTDRSEYTYTFKPRGNPEDHETQRINLGRGIRTANVGFGLSSVVGGYFELDTMTPEYVVSNRNLGTR